jgi:DNA-binding GntR family transcriptional regulator
VVFKWSFYIAPSYPTCCTAIVGTIVVAMHPASEKPEHALPVFVTEQLKQLIYSGEHQPGERFNAAVYDLRALVLGLGFAAERATEHFAENHKVRFVELLNGMDRASEAENPNLDYELNLQFHALVLQLANNQRTQAAYDDCGQELNKKFITSPSFTT